MNFKMSLKRYFKSSSAEFLFKIFLILFIISSLLNVFYGVISKIFPITIVLTPKIQIVIGIIMLLNLIGIVFFEYRLN
ncbi:conserved hypothetical protein [Methanococcus vannielii SB]|uniref:Uncharacterized protein n=1 Tax=Methanococcus vannielii (strain ATCC 35089 / DSM 1224 / JCM 13029 / OCM 148 / SB) TaxID=406327 RepID=A6UST0_METVS|nr:conserved hypothetical protein [Methanococcus vannielii SB]